jgi:arginase family enzyme
MPDDTGVRLNKGRPGAVGGPRAFRAALAGYGVADPIGWPWPAVFDAGDVIGAQGGDEAGLRETHRRVTDAAAALVERGLFPVGIGGGHDLTFAFVRGAMRGRGAFGGVYFDPHLDVRETAGSGMAFRGLMDECGAMPVHNVGFSPLVNSLDHHTWFHARGGWIDLFKPEEWPDFGRPQFVSLDLDAIDASQAPGVSAMNPAGLSVGRLAEYARAAGRHAAVACFDIMELNPAFDPDGRTARAAAHLFLSFLRGLAERLGRAGP